MRSDCKHVEQHPQRRQGAAAGGGIAALPLEGKRCKDFEGEGYTADVSVEGDTKKKIKLRLKYNGKKSVIEGIKLNPERVSPPDFDIDFCMRRRRAR